MLSYMYRGNFMNRRNFLKGMAASTILTTPIAVGNFCPNLAEAQNREEKIQFACYTCDLQLKHTWTIARGSRRIATVILGEITHDGITGVGEAALSTSARYGETKDTVLEFLQKPDFGVEKDIFSLEDILGRIDKIAPGNYAAKACIDIALHDWIGKKLGIPLYKLFGLDRVKTPLTSFSIAIDTPEMMMKRAEEAEEFPILKIKVGKENDKEIISSIRKVTSKPLRVDANEAWKTKEMALEKIRWLEDQGVELIEQPMPANQISDNAWLREKVNMPILADESVGKSSDLLHIKDAFDGINIKLMKCGGLREALKMIYIARALKMKIMIGCMIESSVGISAAAHLSPLIDYADLDGNLLVSNDPYSGAKVIKGKLVLNDRPGLGVEKQQN